MGFPYLSGDQITFIDEFSNRKRSSKGYSFPQIWYSWDIRRLVADAGNENIEYQPIL